MRSHIPFLALAATLVAVGVAPALAHHSAAMFEPVRKIALEAKVVEMLWQNPHSYLEAEVIGRSGNPQKWTIEFQSLGQLAQQGLTDDAIKAGDTLTLVIHPLRNGTTGGDFVGMTLSDGRTFGDVSLPAN